MKPATLRFLRLRNREGYDVYFRLYAGEKNAGYILLDLDHPPPGVLASLQSHGHAPSVVVESSPGHWQAWIRVSTEPLPPALATCLSRRLAQIYAADPASADWRHLGRLAGFTNRKLQRAPTGWFGSLGEMALCPRLPGSRRRGVAGTGLSRSFHQHLGQNHSAPAAARMGLYHRPGCQRAADVSGLPVPIAPPGALSLPGLEHRRDSSPTLPVTIEAPAMDDIWSAATLKSRFPIAYPGAFAAALARKYNCPLVTEDPEFRRVDQLEIDWVGTS